MSKRGQNKDMDQDYQDYLNYKKSSNKLSTRSANPNSASQAVGSIMTDTSPNNQPDNTTRFVLNGVYNSDEGDIGFISNEVGYSKLEDIPEGYNLVGNIPLLDGEVILFLAPINPTSPSRIVRHNKNGNLEDIIVSTGLNFTTHKYIKGKWRLLNLCETVIYFVDGTNPDKAINLARLSDYTINNVDAAIANATDAWNMQLMELEQGYTHPVINLNRVIPSGGRCQLGAYHFAIRYKNEANDVSNYIAFSNPVLVSQFNSSYQQRQGGDPLFTELNYSIELNISGLDTSYPNFEIIAIETVEGISQPYIVATLTTQSEVTYVFRGVRDNSISISLVDLTVDRASYESSETIEIFDNRLFRANLKDKDIAWGKFQQAANRIQTKYFTRAILHEEVQNRYSGSADARTTFDNRSYMRDEVYALGIVWVFKDGTTSPAFHIPGRPKNEAAWNTPISTNLLNKNRTNGSGNNADISFVGQRVNRFPTVAIPGGSYPPLSDSNWDDYSLSDIRHTNTDIGYKNDADSMPGAEERWEVYNTALQEWCIVDPDATGGPYPPYMNSALIDTFGNSIKNEDWLTEDSSPGSLFGLPFSTGYLAYWESEFDYPDFECDGERIFPEGKIRHHKMPDNALEPHFWNLWDKEYILPLGVDFYNIVAPAEYADQVQGYYIVRAERTVDNKTVLDKGIVYHNVAHFLPLQSGDLPESPLKILTNTYSEGVGMTFDWSFPFNSDYYAFHTQTCLGNRHWFDAGFAGGLRINSSDYNPSSNGFQSGMLFGRNDGSTLCMNFSDSDAGIEGAEQAIDVFNVSFHSPKAKFNVQELNMDYLKAEGILQGQWRGGGGNRGIWVAREEKVMSHHVIDYNNWLPLRLYNTNFLNQDYFSLNTNYKVIDEKIIEPHGTYPISSKNLYRRDYFNTGNFEPEENFINFVNVQQQDTLFLNLDKRTPLPYLDQWMQWAAHLIVDNDDYRDGSSAAWSSINYVAVNKYEPPTAEQLNCSYCIYAAAKINNRQIYGSLLDMQYIIATSYFDYSPLYSIQTATPQVDQGFVLSRVKAYGGDTFISKFAFLRNYVTRNWSNKDYEQLWKDIPYYFVESEINAELRHEQIDETVGDLADFAPQNTFFPLRGESEFLRNWDFVRWRGTTWGEADKDDLNEVIERYIDNEYVKNFYAYNTDYSIQNVFKFFFPITNSKLYCGGCLNQYPHRIVYSQQGEQDKSIDRMRIFLAEDKKDITTNHGPITNLFTYSDNLFAHTTQALFIQQVKPFQLNTDALDTVFVGVGDVLDVPEKGLNVTETGYAGSQFKEATKVTEHGVFFPSTDKGSLFCLTGEGLSEITLDGNFNWGKREIPLNLLNQFNKLTNTDYPYLGILDNKSVGMMSTYDERNKRWILTKKDFKIIDENNFYYFEIEDLQDILQGELVPEGSLFFTSRDNTFGTVINSNYEYKEVTFQDEEFFENLSWTISVNAMDKGIKSFHSYIPNFLYNNTNQWFSHYYEDYSIYEHNKGKYLSPFIVEKVNIFNMLSTFSSASLSLITDAYDYNSQYGEYVIDNDTTFNKAVIYNNFQSTGLINLEPKVSPFQKPSNNQSILINKYERTWNLNGFRNNVVDETLPMFTQRWQDIQSDYYIDKLPNQNVIDYNKSLFRKEKLRDKFLITRLIYQTANPKKLVYKFNIDKSKISF
jgi:hypothetical protein